jgi:VWFA-related protein
MRGGTAAGAMLAAAAAALAQEPQGRPDSYREEARVERVILDAHVTDRHGNPIPNLTTDDFRVKVDGRVVPLESAEWVPAGTPEVNPSLYDPAGLSPDLSDAAPGRLIVFLFQTDFEPVRMLGLMRMSNHIRRFLPSLLPSDRVAVLSYDSHLKLRQDFTIDRRKIEDALSASIRTGEPRNPEGVSGPSLARHFDFAAAKSASTIERGLFLVARALRPIPGGKALLFFGYGLGGIGGMGGQGYAERRDYSLALSFLAAARTSVFALDITDADYHSLETSLQHVSDLTGGRYEKTRFFGNFALERVERVISGRYALVFAKPPGPRGVHEVHVSLVRVRGDVSARRYYTD